MESAFSQGVNFIDTAEIYGTYPYVKEALRIKPDAVVCTKSYSYDTATAEASFRTAVEGVGREYLDVFLLHEQESMHTIRGHWQAIEYFLKKKREGYIGALGISTHYIAGVEGANRYPELDIIFPLINQTGIGIADGSAARMLEKIEQSHALGKGVIAMKPLGGGHLINNRRAALDFILEQPCIHTIAIGIQSEAELRYNCAVFSGEEPNEELINEIDAQQRQLMIHDWCTGCGSCVQRCKNHALLIKDGKSVVDAEKCALCGYCAAVCPQFCIKVI